jgi:GNAT superfamily N-acetyltransferase
MFNDNQEIRRAVPSEARKLTDLSFRSKQYWKYPESYFDIWRSELTIEPGYIEKNDVFVYLNGKSICGYYSRLLLEEELSLDGHVLATGYWLEHLFVLPECIGMGVGSRLFRHLCNLCYKERVERFQILADPNSIGFYEKMGCVYKKEIPSTIAGRTTPLLVMDCFRLHKKVL